MPPFSTIKSALASSSTILPCSAGLIFISNEVRGGVGSGCGFDEPVHAASAHVNAIAITTENNFFIYFCSLKRNYSGCNVEELRAAARLLSYV